jgi:hypothetical protein
VEALNIPEHSSPGVYVEEMKIGTKPIEGVSTSTAGIVGVTAKGPLNMPTMIASFKEFSRLFGGYLDEDYREDRYLPHAVEGFFQNGGKRVYVSRIEVTNGSCRDASYIGVCDPEPHKRTGLQTLKNIDEVSIIAVPGGTSRAIQHAMISQCEQMKDRFAVLDSEKDSDPDKIQEQRSRYDSKYAALYYPWLVIRDPFSSGAISIPPSGHICGIYARSDMNHGVHKAPANENIIGVNGLERRITKVKQDALNLIGINCLRAFRGRGIQVWGARTTSSDSLWKYVNVRRFITYLEESIEVGTRWVVFEPKDEKLWARVKQSITQFLTREWRSGALMGVTPEETFFVKCDRATMTQDDIDNGRLIAVIGVAPIKPAEFIIFRISKLAVGSETTE